MGIFPGDIDYSNASPSGRIAAVAAPQAPTGGLEAIGQGLQNLGQAFEKVQQANDAMELSTLQRRDEEIENARLSALQGVNPMDDDAINKISEQAKKEKEANKSKSERVNNALQMHRNSVEPAHDVRFAGEVLQRKAKNAADTFQNEYKIRLGNGDVGGAAKILENAKAMDVVSQSKYDFLAANMFTDSALEMARIDIGTGRYEQAQKSLSELKGLNDAQLDQRDQLLADLHKVKDPQVEQDRVSIAEQIENGTATFQTIQATHLDQKEKDSYWTHAQEVTRQRAKGETIATDQDSRIAANEVVLAYKDGSVQRKNALAGIATYQNKINPTEFKQITDDIYNYADNKDPIKQRKISEYNKTFLYLASKCKLVDGDIKTNKLAAIEYQTAFNKWCKDNPDASDAEITDKFVELTKPINLWWDTPTKDLAEVRKRTGELTNTATVAAPPTQYKIGDTRTINGITWYFKGGNKWEDVK